MAPNSGDDDDDDDDDDDEDDGNKEFNSSNDNDISNEDDMYLCEGWHSSRCKYKHEIKQSSNDEYDAGR